MYFRNLQSKIFHQIRDGPSQNFKEFDDVKGVARAYDVLVNNYNLRFIGDHSCVIKRLADQIKPGIG